jgi:CHAT domain-containing protein
MIEVAVEPPQFAVGQESELVVRLTNSGHGNCTNIVFKLGLPSDFLVLTGSDRIEICGLRAGEHFSQRLILRPRNAGHFTVRSPNFSYRDQYGRPVRVLDFQTRLSVVAKVPDPASGRRPIDVAVGGGELALGEWDVLLIRIRNASGQPLSKLTMAVSGPARFAPPGAVAEIAGIAAGEDREIRFVVFPADMGSYVPVQVRTTYFNSLGRIGEQHDLLSVTVRRRAEGVAAGGTRRADTILYLAASPADMPRLRSDLEMMAIQTELQLGRFQDRFDLKFYPAAGFDDIGRALGAHRPRIVHFSGHGERDGSVYVEDDLGSGVPVPPEGLAALLGQHADTVECLIVNACHTMLLADAMATRFDHVIAMRTEIRDGAAITFSIGFYQGLAAGLPIRAAFERGRIFLQAHPLSKSEYETPVLLTKGQRPVFGG